MWKASPARIEAPSFLLQAPTVPPDSTHSWAFSEKPRLPPARPALLQLSALPAPGYRLAGLQAGRGVNKVGDRTEEGRRQKQERQNRDTERNHERKGKT